MKNRFLAGLAILSVLFAALAYAGDQDKDKTKTKPPAKPTAVVYPKPSSAPSHAAAPATQHTPTQAAQPKPAVTLHHQTAVTTHPAAPAARPVQAVAPHQAAVGHPAQSPARGPVHPVVGQVNVVELHQRMNAPVRREVLIRDRDHYHQVELVRYRMHGTPYRFEPRHRVVLVSLRIMPHTYYHRRAVFYETYGFVPPVYIYDLRPSYGLWCATFLAFMLDRIALAHQYEYSLMYYDHMNEPEFIEWRQEMNGLAAENAELREKLAALDQRVSELEGTQRNAAYVPEEAGDVALSPQAIDKLAAGPEK